MSELLIIGGTCLALGLLIGWLWGHVCGIEEERARQIDARLGAK